MANIEYVREQILLAGSEKYLDVPEVSKIQRALVENEILVAIVRYRNAKEEGLLFITDQRWVFCNNQHDDFAFKIFLIDDIGKSIVYNLEHPSKIAAIISGKEQEFILPEKGESEVVRGIYRLQHQLRRYRQINIDNVREDSREHCISKLYEIAFSSDSDHKRLLKLLPTQEVSDQYIATTAVFGIKFSSVSDYERLLKLLPMQVVNEYYIAAASICKIKFSSVSDYERLLKLLPVQAAKEFYVAAITICKIKFSSVSDYERLLKLLPVRAAKELLIAASLVIEEKQFNSVSDCERLLKVIF